MLLRLLRLNGRCATRGSAGHARVPVPSRLSALNGIPDGPRRTPRSARPERRERRWTG
ncbi:hypothetical protein BN2537_625 [Streptomyces venezuelae]|nr:hypothetical protein BN2537_625 [Streptomyces venezuelae]